MYLYDPARTGRATRSRLVGAPVLDWKFRLRSQGRFATETQTLEDSAGNFYFGGHDGCVYSVTNDGELRWIYSTEKKIYPTPILADDRLYVLTGTGYAIALETHSGLPCWEMRVADRPRKFGILSDLALYLSFNSYDYDPRQRKLLRAWGSPNISNDRQTLYYCTRGTGLAAVQATDGRVLWRYDLGPARHSFSGPTVHSNGTIYVASQRKWLHAVSPGGEQLWKSPAPDLNAWGGISLDEERGRLFLASSFKNEDGAVQAYTLNGVSVWRQKIPGALRGGATLASDGSLFVASGNGSLYRLSGDDGRVMQKVTIATDFSMISLWTSPVIAGDEILLSAVKNKKDGGFLIFDHDLKLMHEFSCGKALSPPHIDKRGRVLFGSWDGHLYCLSSK